MSGVGTYDENRQNRWYFGGIASAAAACVTHPLDLMKVLLQTQTEKPPLSIIQLISKIFRTEGVSGFYSGISASLMRQLTFTLTRIGFYEYFKYYIADDNKKMLVPLAFGSGICGALVGLPAEVTNIRMQNDMRLPPEQRRNYKNVFDGLSRILKEEGFKTLYVGTTPNIIRGILMTMSANMVYDLVKYRLLDLGFKDIPSTHLTCSIIAAVTGTTALTPVDVVKTRIMNSKPGEFKGLLDVIMFTAKQGPSAFYRGYVPATMRSVPHLTILFLLMEQMRLYFGHLPPPTRKKDG